VFYDVDNEFGHGFPESVYEQALTLALLQSGMKLERQVAVSVGFRSREIGNFWADRLIDGKVLLELKAARTIERRTKSSC